MASAMAAEAAASGRRWGHRGLMGANLARNGGDGNTENGLFWSPVDLLLPESRHDHALDHVGELHG